MLRAKIGICAVLFAVGCYPQSSGGGYWKTVKDNTSSGLVTYGCGGCGVSTGTYSVITDYYIVRHQIVARIVKNSSEDYWTLFRGASKSEGISDWDDREAAKRAAEKLGPKE